MAEPPEFSAGEGLLRGARSIAHFVFGNEDEWRKVYAIAESGELPIFRLGGRLAARPSSLARAITERERAAMKETAA